MPIHDWTRVPAGIFHDFHHEWISTIKQALNRGLLPRDHYALAEQFAGQYGPDVLTLEGPPETPMSGTDDRGAGIALAELQPKVTFRARTEEDYYAAKANRIAVRHVSDHRVIAVVEIVSPGSKAAAGPLRTFVDKAAELLHGGVHLMVIDPFPPSRRDPHGLQHLIWDEFDTSNFVLPPDRPLTIGSYIGGMGKEVFIEPVAVGALLPDMPLFLTREIYVQVPLEATYQSAWEAVPAIWRKALVG